MEKVEEKSKVGNRIFYIVLILLILGSVGVTFYKIVWQKDYQIVAEVSCDPTVESCFYYEGVICEDSDLECVPEDAYDYKLISKKASDIYTCEQTDEKLGCDEELSCTDGEENCSYTYCDPENLAVGELCSISLSAPILDIEIPDLTSSSTLE